MITSTFKQLPFTVTVLGWKSKFHTRSHIAKRAHYLRHVRPSVCGLSALLSKVRSTRAQRLRNHCCRGRKLSITYSECVSVASVIQLAKRLRPIILSHVACPAVYNIFPHYLTNDTTLGKKLLNIKCVFWFSLQLLPKIVLILGRTRRNTEWPKKNVNTLHSSISLE